MQDSDIIYHYYKPLRNQLRELNFLDTLYVIWAYHINYFNPRFFPSDIESVPAYLAQDFIQKCKFLAPWDLGVLTREVILNTSSSYQTRSIRHVSDFMRVLDKYRGLEDYLSQSRRLEQQGSPLAFMFRSGHHQFPRQKRPNQEHLTRYAMIFGSPDIARILKSKLGLTPRKLFLTGLVLWGVFQNNFKVNRYINVELPEISSLDFERFIGFVSLSLPDLRQLIEEERCFDGSFLYYSKAQRAYPIIQTTDDNGQAILICPDPISLFWRLSDGVYYELCREPGFDQAFGDSLQSYVGKVLKTGKRNNMIVLEEEIYGTSQSQRTIDWILQDANETLFIEVKAKRISYEARIHLDDSIIKTELKKMAEIICQTYKSINKYQRNLYPHFPYNPDIKITPMVITLENWRIWSDYMYVQLNNFVIGELKAAGLDPVLLEQSPYLIGCVAELEDMIQIANAIGLGEITAKVTSAERKYWLLEAHLRVLQEQYKVPIKFLFPEEFQAIFPSRLN